MMIGRSLALLLGIVLAVTVFETLRDLVQEGQSVLALASVIVPIGIGLLVSARGSTRRFAANRGGNAEGRIAILRQLSENDQTRLARLARSGNSIGAIKASRELVDTDLRTAKNAVDQLAASGPDQPE